MGLQGNQQDQGWGKTAWQSVVAPAAVDEGGGVAAAFVVPVVSSLLALHQLTSEPMRLEEWASPLCKFPNLRAAAEA